MAKSRSNSNQTEAASKLRSIIWSVEEGNLLGSEEDLTLLVGASRPTVRAAARLLENEGLIKVRRGINGGYFAARPRVDVIESSVSAYLQSIVGETEEVTEIASRLWLLVVRKAARLESPEKKKLVQQFKKEFSEISESIPMVDLAKIEETCQKKMFDLTHSGYIELIFHINKIFASQRVGGSPANPISSSEHQEFVHTWRNARLLEFDAIEAGNQQLSEMAAKFARSLFHKRIWGTPPRND